MNTVSQNRTLSKALLVTTGHLLLDKFGDSEHNPTVIACLKRIPSQPSQARNIIWSARN